MSYRSNIGRAVSAARRLAAARGIGVFALAFWNLPTSSNAADSQPTSDTGLSYRGITLYGVVDLGVQYQTHGALISDYFSGGSGEIIQRYDVQSILGVTPSNLTQSKLGLSGIEPIVDELSAVFKVETYFNPQSGQLVDALKSLTLNNGKPLAEQSTNLDSSMAGQVFQQSFAGLQSRQYGTVTYGRQNSLLADGIGVHDPNAGAQAFSLLGLSGTAAGGGDTEDRRLDSALKYEVYFRDLIRLGALYRFKDANEGSNTVTQASLGVEHFGLSVDGYYARAKDGVAHSTLTAAQVTALSAFGLSSSQSVAGTVSDNTTYSVMSHYQLRLVGLYAAYERVRYTDSSVPLSIGDDAIGGYKLGAVDNNAFLRPRILNIYWAGAQMDLRPVQFVAAYYGYHQGDYGIGADADCSTGVSKTCSGALDDFSVSANWRVTRRFTIYSGAMYSRVRGGLANGYLHTTDLTTTTGWRFTI